MTARPTLLLLLVLAACAAPLATSPEADEQAVRRWFDDWLQATTVGDLELARSLIADDAVFFVPGVGTLDKPTFAAAATAVDPGVDYALDCEVTDLEVHGDRAWLTARLGLTMTDEATGQTAEMAGHGLAVLERSGDGWVVVRDMNTLLPVDG